MAHTRPPRGFTLIELMIVVAIVGILTTVALPGFQRSVLRTKVAERSTIMLRLKNVVQEYYVRTGSSVPPGVTDIDSGWNPPLPAMAVKRTMATNLANWNVYFSRADGGSSLPQDIEGGVYYTYRFVVAESATGASLIVLAIGDLDGDGVYSNKRIDYTRNAGVYQILDENPDPGAEDDAGPDATF